MAFSLSDEDSFENLEEWLKDVEQNNTISNAMKILVGTKSDLTERRVVRQQDAEKFAKKHNFRYFETSAKEGTNIDEMFQDIANEGLKINNTIGFEEHQQVQRGQSVKLKKEKKDKKKKKRKKSSKCSIM